MTHNFELGDDYSLGLEGTFTSVDEDDFYGAGDDTYWHGRIGVAKSLGSFDFDLSFHTTTIDDNPNADNRLVFTVSTSFEG